MIKFKVNSLDMAKKLNNTTMYSQGFLDGIEMNRLQFNRVLGGYTAEALGEYIDSKARMNPESLHHVYEWNSVGDKGSRLFSFSVKATNSSVTFDGKFLMSKSSPPNSQGHVFSKKAEIMENKISVTVTPKTSPVLVFEDDGETVFTTNSVYIANPGGDAVAGSFGKVIDEFFDVYFTQSILSNILSDLSNPKEFLQYFSQGTKSGKSIGVRAGRQYFSVRGTSK